ncbi:conserved hypothetical protein [Culex quinquefasciatus]|uniref:Uncharacterized protein n=1 Tax=Culex quinquefasciatus TaxID=7176 RepID=B0WID1_CULQU|nr:conserved hypothetical protein [Culex quinquefasciatus]|eukprot:XP_001848465.1 conserved hypothetical protein [Culex quinquefasciatus]
MHFPIPNLSLLVEQTFQFFLLQSLQPQMSLGKSSLTAYNKIGLSKYYYQGSVFLPLHGGLVRPFDGRLLGRVRRIVKSRSVKHHWATQTRISRAIWDWWQWGGNSRSQNIVKEADENMTTFMGMGGTIFREGLRWGLVKVIETVLKETVVKVVVDKFSSKPPPLSLVQNSPNQHILPHYWRQFGVRSIISPPEAATESQPFGHGLYTNDVFGESCG